MAQLQNRRRRSITCWGVVNKGILEVTALETIRKIAAPSTGGCGEAGHLGNNCSSKSPQHALVISLRKCVAPKKDQQMEMLKSLREDHLENNKYSQRVEKKFGAIDPDVRLITMPSTPESDPWNHEAV
ncbi:hypothetical protein TNCV_2211201 [Trichonephila clavipes]|nr:hypothetical protein TNCV_2211201 [Trichonephila clavipes]